MTSDTPPPVDRPVEEPAYVPPPTPPPPPYVYPQPRQRPFGVTLLAILMIIGGILSLLAAIGSFLVTAFINVQEIIDQVGQQIPQWLIEAVPFIFAIMGVVFLILAIIAFLLAYGYLKGRGWSWTLSIVLLVLSIIFGVVNLVISGLAATGVVSAVISLIISVIILIYLMRPGVKAWFGKA